MWGSWPVDTAFLIPVFSYDKFPHLRKPCAVWNQSKVQDHKTTWLRLLMCTSSWGQRSRKGIIHVSPFHHYRQWKGQETTVLTLPKEEEGDYSNSEIQAGGVPDFFHLSQGMLCVQTSLLFSGIISLSSWFQPLDFGSRLWVILPVSKEWYVLASRWLSACLLHRKREGKRQRTISPQTLIL